MKREPVTEERLAKLPEWVRRHIEHLERMVAQQQRLLTEIADGSGKNPFSYENTLDRGPGPAPRRYCLPTYANLSVFNGGQRHEAPGCLDLSVRDESEKLLQVSAVRGRIVVLPSCTNVVYLKGEDF